MAFSASAYLIDSFSARFESSSLENLCFTKYFRDDISLIWNADWERVIIIIYKIITLLLRRWHCWFATTKALIMTLLA